MSTPLQGGDSLKDKLVSGLLLEVGRAVPEFFSAEAASFDLGGAGM